MLSQFRMGYVTLGCLKVGLFDRLKFG